MHSRKYSKQCGTATAGSSAELLPCMLSTEPIAGVRTVLYCHSQYHCYGSDTRLQCTVHLSYDISAPVVLQCFRIQEVQGYSSSSSLLWLCGFS
jgi:hypothetical protein